MAKQSTPIALDRALHELDQNSTVDERFTVIRQLIEYWHGPLRDKDGYKEPELRRFQLPASLRQWFQLAGHRTSLISGQNSLLRPSKMTVDDSGRLLFYVENQGVYLWSTTLVGDDPPVFGRFNEDDIPWSEEGMTVSEFLIGACLFQAILAAPFGASASWAEQTTLDAIAAIIRPLSLVSWRWPAFPSQFYGENGAFMFACPNDDNQGNRAFSIWIGAKNEKALSFLKQFVDDTWDYVAI